MTEQQKDETRMETLLPHSILQWVTFGLDVFLQGNPFQTWIRSIAWENSIQTRFTMNGFSFDGKWKWDHSVPLFISLLAFHIDSSNNHVINFLKCINVVYVLQFMYLQSLYILQMNQTIHHRITFIKQTNQKMLVVLYGQKINK